MCHIFQRGLCPFIRMVYINHEWFVLLGGFPVQPGMMRQQQGMLNQPHVMMKQQPMMINQQQVWCCYALPCGSETALNLF